MHGEKTRQGKKIIHSRSGHFAGCPESPGQKLLHAWQQRSAEPRVLVSTIVLSAPGNEAVDPARTLYHCYSVLSVYTVD